MFSGPPGTCIMWGPDSTTEDSTVEDSTAELYLPKTRPVARGGQGGHEPQ